MSPQLWKDQFILEFGRMRLRGGRGFIQRRDGREVRPLPSRAKSSSNSPEDNIDWKWMFRISCNWRRGRCSIESINDAQYLRNSSLPSSVLLTGSLLITSLPTLSASPLVYLHRTSGLPITMSGSHRTKTPTHITTLTLDQSPPSSLHLTRLACFYDTGEFSIFSIDHTNPESSRRLISYLPQLRTDRTAPIQHAAYHHPLLATLSEGFDLSLYDMSDDNIVHTQTLSSFTSFPPSSLVLSAPTARKDRDNYYKLVLAYAVPVFPAHWSVAVTELKISSGSRTDSNSSTSSPPPCTVLSTRSTRAYDFPPGWVDESALRDVKAQWGRKVARVADTQTDGKWVVLAPADRLPSPAGSGVLGTTSSALQLYRLHLPPAPSGSSSSGSRMASATTSPRLTFVRFLHGHTGPVIALSLADGRCVSLGADGSIWAWDLEKGWSAEVQAPRHSVGSLSGSQPRESSGSSTDDDDSTVDDEESSVLPKALIGSVVFDERRIVSTTAHGIELRNFDV
ncbi:hypothetical protein SCHPADRAFT_898821 [Schizopora paradoxa]|uniref:Uncharacterized protein n=1 Tax=Schizopora paradoxa TaxID=27342 RepID=A0A0H2S5Q2_9AGAM|nr:hypothetical protein SCHPADRAFT_898821 [Schizopora paradoxa]